MKHLFAPINKVIRPWVVAVIALVIACTGLSFAYLSERHSNEANARAVQVANCVNAILGTRQGTTSADSDALLQWAISLGEVLEAPSGSAEQQAQYTHFAQVDLPNLIHVYTTDKQFRKEHPLGKC